MSTQQHRSVLHALAFGFVLLGGCYDVAWLPDSSGIVFIRGENRSVVRYDIATQTEKAVATHEWLTWGGVPAVKPDGKQVAVVRHKVTADSSKVQMIVHDLSGKQVYLSKWFDFPRGTEKERSPHDSSCAAFWSPDGGRILFAHPSQEVGVYDFRTQTVQLHPNLDVVGAFMFLGLSPIIPDGRGFIGRPTEEGPSAEGAPQMNPATVLVDWEGRRQRLKFTPAAERQKTEQAPEKPARGESFWLASWSQAVATVQLPDGAVRTIDCQNRLVDYKPPKKDDPLLKYAAAARVSVYKLQDGLLLQARDADREADVPTGAAPQPITGKSMGTSDIEIVRRMQEDGRWHWVTKAIAEVRTPLKWQAVPSPNGQYVLVCAFYAPWFPPTRLLLVSKEGELVADIKRGPPQPETGEPAAPDPIPSEAPPPAPVAPPAPPAAPGLTSVPDPVGVARSPAGDRDDPGIAEAMFTS